MPRRTAANNVFQADVFRAIAQRPRRQIIEILARRRELAVGALVLALGLPQPAVSKHLGALRAAGIVSVSKQGQQRMYAMNYDQLRPVYDWIKLFEQHWQRQLDRIAVRAESRATTLSKISKTVPSEPPDQNGSS
jgi:DNA-binding transcriptional ArsR family regulator